jgi:hypothetical protein
MFYFCSMSSEADIAAQHLLEELAELSLGMARKLSAAIHATEDTGEMVALAEVYAKVGRCLRMSVALAMRLRRGEPMAPAREAAERAEPAERDESRFLEERPERLEQENLYDRLPSGDLPTQIAAVARSLSRAARALPAANDYGARCEALITQARRLQPSGPAGLPPDEVALGPNRAVDVALARPRGPPRALN